MDSQTPQPPVSGGNTPIPQVSNGLPTTGPASFSSGKNGLNRRKKVLIGAGVAAAVVLGAAGYVFGYYLPNQPSNVYGRALSNTSKGYDKLIEYTGDKALAKKFETVAMSGKMSVAGEGLSGDGSFTGKADNKGNGTLSGDFGMSGIRLNFEGLMKDVESSESPDVYFKIKGLKGIDQLAGTTLEQFDDKWVFLDHTFFDTYAQQAVGEKSAQLTAPTQEQVMDAAKKVGEVNKRYLFTDDESKAVFKMKEYKGREAVDGKDTMHYVVEADKDRLKTYVDELGKALDSSKLNDWATDSYKKKLSEVVEVNQLKDEVSDIKDNTFDMWVNTKTKMIHKIRMQSAADKYTEIGLNYDGGDEYPFFISSKEGKEDYKLTLALNTKTDTVKLDLYGKTSGQNEMTIKASVELKPGTGDVNVTAPSDVMPFMEALGGVMGAAMFGSGSLEGTATDFDSGLGSYTISQ
jgi:hypothetical protein